ncbi:MAG: hypothetical protein ABSG01_00220 [Anaerolineales bacterium]|jgi:hypothetical protein
MQNPTKPDWAKRDRSEFLAGRDGFCDTSIIIVTVTHNPSLDRSLSVPVFYPGTLQRAWLIIEDLGGKGIHVLRALQVLGIPRWIVGFASEWNGRLVLGSAGRDFLIFYHRCG